MAESVADSVGVGYGSIIYDDRGENGGGSCWYNAKRCWRSPLDDGATHRLVLQDDVIACNDFLEYANKCINKHPNAIWTFYNGVWIKESCKKKDTPYTMINGGRMSGQGICMPIDHIEKMIYFSDMWLGNDFIHDDGRASFYCLCNNVPVMCCIPSLLQHAQTKSMIPHHNHPNRVSRTFEIDVSSENWDSDEYNMHPLTLKKIWLSKDHPRKAAVERMIEKAKREYRKGVESGYKKNKNS